MKNQTKVTGIVLSSFPVGENDRRLTILTKERGKMQVFASNCRKASNRLHAITQQLIWGEFVISESRNYNRLSSGECRDFFGYVKDTYEHILYSTYFAEVTEYYTVEGQDQRDILNLLYVTFLAMKKDQVPLPLIRRIFEYKLLVLQGTGMHCDSCVNCGSQEDLVSVSFENGGILCSKCSGRIPGTSVKKEALYVLQFVTAASLRELYSFVLDEETFREFEWIVNRFFAMISEHTFRSAAMLGEA